MRWKYGEMGDGGWVGLENIRKIGGRGRTDIAVIITYSWMRN
jgi:hypothetical protein